MTDPVYGDNPIDPGELWDETFRPPLVLDPEWVVWRNVWAAKMEEILESQWAIRWRRALTTGGLAQIIEHGGELGFLQPDGWADDRYQAVLVALQPASYARQTTDVVTDVAEALADVGQSFQYTETFPATARFVFLDTPADDAETYFSVLNDRARPDGEQYFVMYHPGPDPYILGVSQLGGGDSIAGWVGDTYSML